MPRSVRIASSSFTKPTDKAVCFKSMMLRAWVPTEHWKHLRTTKPIGRIVRFLERSVRKVACQTRPPLAWCSSLLRARRKLGDVSTNRTCCQTDRQCEIRRWNSRQALPDAVTKIRRYLGANFNAHQRGRNDSGYVSSDPQEAPLKRIFGLTAHRTWCEPYMQWSHHYTTLRLRAGSLPCSTTCRLSLVSITFCQWRAFRS